MGRLQTEDLPLQQARPQSIALASNDSSTNTPARGRFGRRGISINVVEVKIIDGKLMFTNPNLPTYVDLKPERELEK